MAMCGEKDKAVNRLKKYAETVSSLLKVGLLHGDSYFSKLDSWFEKLDLGPQMPRSKKLVIQNARENLNNPVFVGLQELKEFHAVDIMLEAIEKEG